MSSLATHYHQLGHLRTLDIAISTVKNCQFNCYFTLELLVQLFFCDAVVCAVMSQILNTSAAHGIHLIRILIALYCSQKLQSSVPDLNGINR